ncbi:MAG: cytochrome b N-terminal domain-containing protein [Chloroflexi bacterium]|nr:cytochrome b N-terminal domain-containing protein [Chloroflexota bacterium]
MAFLPVPLRDLPREINRRIRNSRAWKSFFRSGYPDNRKDQAQIVIGNVFLHLHPVKVPTNAIRITYTYCLGGISFLLFLILTITGVLLMFYYVPSVERAYNDIQALSTTVAFGQLMRNLHRWAAHGMVLSVFLHMMRVFYTGAYKPPREFNWVIGVTLLFVTFGMSYTGYLLPWDQLGIWAITIGLGFAGYTPFFGEQAKQLIFGALEINQDSLLRFYVLHVIGLPLVAAVLMSVHFWRIRRDGGISTPL